MNNSQVFSHDHTCQLSCLSQDKNGETPDLSLIGLEYLHIPSGKKFTVKNYIFLGDSDEWAYTLEEFDGATSIARSLRDFNGHKNNSTLRRFSVVQDLSTS